jgi:hypothetical protein
MARREGLCAYSDQILKSLGCQLSRAFGSVAQLIGENRRVLVWKPPLGIFCWFLQYEGIAPYVSRFGKYGDCFLQRCREIAQYDSIFAMDGESVVRNDSEQSNGSGNQRCEDGGF